MHSLVRLRAASLYLAAVGCGASPTFEPDPPPDPTGRYALFYWAGSLPTPGLFSILADTVELSLDAPGASTGTIVERLWFRPPPPDTLGATEVTGTFQQGPQSLVIRYDCGGPQLPFFCLLVPQSGEVAQLVGDDLRVYGAGGLVLREYRRLPAQ